MPDAIAYWSFLFVSFTQTSFGSPTKNTQGLRPQASECRDDRIYRIL